MKFKGIEISNSGKIKLKKDDKIDISEFIEECLNTSIKNSVNDVRISRLEGLPSKEEIIIDGSANYRLEATTNCSSIKRIIELMNGINSNETQTIVIPMSKKKASNLENNDVIEWLCKTSTFVSVYTQIKKTWDELNTDDNSCYTNVMYIPKLSIFLEKNGKMRKNPISINLMIIALPSINKATNGMESIDDIEYTNRIINDSIEACIKCGTKNIVINPYSMSALFNDVHYTARYWHGKTETQRVIENIRNITFSINDDDLYVIFCKNK